jgi:hypothetical protein
LTIAAGLAGWSCALAMGCWACTVIAVTPSNAALAPFLGTAGAVPSPPWTYASLPEQKFPRTRITIDSDKGSTVLRVEAVASYGNLLHRLDRAGDGVLTWRWKVERPLRSPDLRSRQGDDVALKVCALYAMPRQAVPFVERQLLRLAELRTGESLPAATLCYVWDPNWPAETLLANAYSRRVRYITLGLPGQLWQTVRRDLAADFLRAFGGESTSVPMLQAIAVGADADNTGGSSLGFIADLQLYDAIPQ